MLCYYFLVKFPVPNGYRRLAYFIGTENNIDQERVTAAFHKAVACRLYALHLCEAHDSRMRDFGTMDKLPPEWLQQANRLITENNIHVTVTDVLTPK
jgi:hypothetical protein